MTDFYGLIIFYYYKTVTKKCDIFDFEQPVFLPVFTYMYSPFIVLTFSLRARLIKDTRIIQTLWPVPLVSVLTGFHCSLFCIKVLTSFFSLLRTKGFIILLACSTVAFS